MKEKKTKSFFFTTFVFRRNDLLMAGWDSESPVFDR